MPMARREMAMLENLDVFARERRAQEPVRRTVQEPSRLMSPNSPEPPVSCCVRNTSFRLTESRESA
jgi:hypothetical protein